MFIINNDALLHLRSKENLVKHEKVSRYYDQSCRFVLGWNQKVLRYESCHNQQFQSEKMLSNYMWETKRTLDQNSSLKYTTFVTLQAYSNVTKFS